MKLLLPDGELAIVTRRCVQDYIDQVRPALDDHEAWKDMQRLVNEHGVMALDRPAWMAPCAEDAEDWPGVPRWVVIGDVAVLVHYAPTSPDVLLATAVVTRGSVGGDVRRIKSERAAGRRAARKQASRKQNKNKQNARFRRERRDRLERDSRRDQA